MSTMLKSAAMTLLSKTLQTFLYKYLLDVDVEGVAMPSLMDSEGTSGWGVRLSNVRLREGIDLMMLPGKKKIRTKKITKNDYNEHTPRQETEANNNADADDDKIERHAVSNRRVENLREQHCEHHVPSLKKLEHNDEMRVDESFESSGNEENNFWMEKRGVEVNLEEDIKTVLLEDDTRFDYSSPHEERSCDTASYVSSRPPTPTNESGSMFNCFVPDACGKRPQKNTDGTPKKESIEKTASPDKGVSNRSRALSTDIFADDDFSDTNIASNSRSRSYIISGHTAQEFDDKHQNTGTTIKQDSRISGDNEAVHASGYKDISEPILHAEEETKTQNKKNTEEEEEEEGDGFVLEQDMALRLGVGGRIGILDVRLISGQIHVLVEDAFLVIEAVPKSEEDENSPTADKENGKTGSAQKEDGSVAEPPKQPKKAQPSANNKLEGAGDRVMEKSAIARALSAIPHILLRDCRVRFVIRNGYEAMNEKGTPELSEEDSVVEIGVELLSVTDGEDFLAHFRPEDEETSPVDSALNEPEKKYVSTKGLQKQQSMSTMETTEPDENKYLTKRIRTGKGPEGGICVKIFPPGRRTRQDVAYMFGPPEDADNNNNSAKWALHSWMASQQMCLFRCSGLDLRARVFLGKKEENKIIGWTSYDEEYDDITIDSMLFGVDYFSAGSRRPLPPLGESAPLDESCKAADPELDNGKIQEDSNGIQRYQINSIYHKVARGLRPTICNGNHLPGENCTDCWDKEYSDSLTENPLDNAMPMPGLTLNLSIDEPLEINVDRPSLQVISMMKHLFTKDKGETASASRNTPVPADDTDNRSAHDNENGSKMMEDATKERPNQELCYENINDSFPSYMQPETIQVTGIHLANFSIRIHIMREGSAVDYGHSFCYWDVAAKCITVDHQSLSARERAFQDVQIDIGEFLITEYKGTIVKRLVSLGVPYDTTNKNNNDEVDDDDDNIEDSDFDVESRDDNWPSRASVLLNVPVPYETAMYRSRERHGVQIRYITSPMSSSNDIGSKKEERHSVANIRVGTGFIDTQWKIKNEIMTVVREIKMILSNKVAGASSSLPSSQSATTTPPPPPPDVKDDKIKKKSKEKDDKQKTPMSSSIIKYKVQIDGGTLSLDPLVQICLPMTSISGEHSSTDGFFLQTVLNKVKFAYGKGRRKVDGSSNNNPKKLSLSRMASLPENERLRILLFLDNLQPIERALNLREETNPFLRCQSVNRGIVQAARRHNKMLLLKQKQSSSSSKIKRSTSSSSTTSISKQQQKSTLKTGTIKDTLQQRHISPLPPPPQQQQQHPRKKNILPPSPYENNEHNNNNNINFTISLPATTNKKNNRHKRQELLTKIMKLDDEKLEYLWSTHLKLERRQQRRSSNEQQQQQQQKRSNSSNTTTNGGISML